MFIGVVPPPSFARAQRFRRRVHVTPRIEVAQEARARRPPPRLTLTHGTLAREQACVRPAQRPPTRCPARGPCRGYSTAKKMLDHIYMSSSLPKTSVLPKTNITSVETGASAAIKQKVENLKSFFKPVQTAVFTDKSSTGLAIRTVGRKQILGWKPNPNLNQEGHDFDISLERPLEGMRKQLDALMTVRGKRPTTSEHLNTVARFIGQSEAPQTPLSQYDLSKHMVDAFVSVVKGKSIENIEALRSSSEFEESGLVQLVEVYNNDCSTIRTDRSVAPQPGPPIIIERDMTRSAIGSEGVWFRQVRRLESETRQVELVVRLGRSIRERASHIKVKDPHLLALDELDSTVSDMVSVAANLFQGIFKKNSPYDFRALIKNAIKENQKLRAVGVLLSSLNVCELAACSTSYRAIRLANRMAMGKTASNENKSLAHEKSTTVFSPGAIDLSYDMINRAFQAHLVRIFTQVITWVNDALQEKLDLAMFELIKMGTRNRFDEDKVKAAEHLCTVVVTYFRMLIVVNFGRGGGEGSNLMQQVTDTMINRLTSGTRINARTFRFTLPRFVSLSGLLRPKQGITIVNRDKAMLALYAAHGVAIRFHPIDAQGLLMGKIAIARGTVPNPKGSASSFFSVHAPLCVMLVDYAFTDDIFEHKHVKGKKVVRNPKTVEGILQLVNQDQQDQALLTRCLKKLSLDTRSTSWQNDLAKQDHNVDSLRRAGRMVYNAIMSTDQFHENIDEDVRNYYMRSHKAFKKQFETARSERNTYRSSAGRLQSGGASAKIDDLAIRLLNVKNS